MKLIAFLKVSLKMMIRSSAMYIFVFAVFPMFLALVMGYFQKDLFTTPVKVDKVNINVFDMERSSFSKGLAEYLDSREVSKIIAVKRKKEKIQVIIPKGYRNGFIHSGKVYVTIKVKDAEKKNSAEAVRSVVDAYDKAKSEEIIINKKLQEKNISKSAKEEIMRKVNGKLQAAYRIKGVRNKIVRVKKSLDSYEFYSVSMIGFMFLMLILSLAAGIYQEKENGIFRRILQTSIKRGEYLNYSLASDLMFSIVLNTIYVLAFRIIGLSFKVSPHLLLIVIIAQSILCTAATGVLVSFFSKKSSTTIVNISILAQVILGGMLFPLKDSMGNILKTMQKFSPDALISKAYKNLLIYNSFDSIKFYVAAMLLLSAALYMISVIKVSIKWGEEQ